MPKRPQAPLAFLALLAGAVSAAPSDVRWIWFPEGNAATKAPGATRCFRGVTYHITVERVGPGNDVALLVDDVPVTGNIVPLPGDGRTEVGVKARVGQP